MRSKVGSNAEALMLISEGLREGVRAPNIYKYTPHVKQHKFHTSTKKKKLYIGGNRSGKTTGGVTEDIWRATCRHPYRPDLNAIGPNRGRMVAVDFVNGVEKIIFPQFQQWLYPSAMRGGAWETAYDKTLRTLYFTNGSFIEFMSYDQDLDKFAGTSRHWIHFDEEPPKDIYIENMARLIDTDGDFWITMTPVEGMTWVFDDLYEPNYEKPEEDRKVAIVEVDMRDNPFLSDSAIESFLESIDEDEREARIEGKFVQVGGKIYKNFNPEKGKVHVLDEPIPTDELKLRFKGSKDHLIVCALDHGLSNPTAVLWMAVDAAGYITVFREHYRADWTIDKHAARIKEINAEHGFVPDLYVADPSIKNRNPVTGTSIHEEYIKYGIPFTLGNNDKQAGIVRVKKYLKIAPRGYPRLRIAPNCTWLIWEFKRYHFKTYAQKKLNYQNNLFEEPHDKDNHALDALRYAIMSRPDLIADSANESTDETLSRLGILESSHASVGMDRNADPWDNESRDDWDKDLNTIPVGTDWEYDENLGGYW